MQTSYRSCGKTDTMPPKPFGSVRSQPQKDDQVERLRNLQCGLERLNVDLDEVLHRPTFRSQYSTAASQTTSKPVPRKNLRTANSSVQTETNARALFMKEVVNILQSSDFNISLATEMLQALCVSSSSAVGINASTMTDGGAILLEKPVPYKNNNATRRDSGLMRGKLRASSENSAGFEFFSSGVKEPDMEDEIYDYSESVYSCGNSCEPLSAWETRIGMDAKYDDVERAEYMSDDFSIATEYMKQNHGIPTAIDFYDEALDLEPETVQVHIRDSFRPVVPLNNLSHYPSTPTVSFMREINENRKLENAERMHETLLKRRALRALKRASGFAVSKPRSTSTKQSLLPKVYTGSKILERLVKRRMFEQLQTGKKFTRDLSPAMKLKKKMFSTLKESTLRSKLEQRQMVDEDIDVNNVIDFRRMMYNHLRFGSTVSPHERLRELTTSNDMALKRDMFNKMKSTLALRVEEQNLLRYGLDCLKMNLDKNDADRNDSKKGVVITKTAMNCIVERLP